MVIDIRLARLDNKFSRSMTTRDFIYYAQNRTILSYTHQTKSLTSIKKYIVYLLQPKLERVTNLHALTKLINLQQN